MKLKRPSIVAWLACLLCGVVLPASAQMSTAPEPGVCL